MDQPSAPTGHSKLRIAGGITAILIMLYALLGFFIAPRFALPKITEAISSFTGGSTELREVAINPFALSIELTGLDLHDRSGERTIGLQRLYINYELRSLLTGALTFSEIAIDSPYISARLEHDGSLNLKSMFPDSPADTSASEPTELVMDLFTITGGAIMYEDRTQPKPIITRIDSLGFTLHDFTTKPLGEGRYQFLAATARAETLAWNGTLRFSPFRSDGSIRLAGLTARTVGEYAQNVLHASPASGTFAFSAEYHVDASVTPMEFRVVQGVLSARSFSLYQPEIGGNVLDLPRLDARDISFDMNKRAFRIGSIDAAGGTLTGVRFPDESNNLTKIVIRDSAADAGTPWDILIAKMKYSGMAVTWTDSSITPVARFELSGADITIDSMKPGRPDPVHIVATSGILPDTGTIALDGHFTTEPITLAMQIHARHVSVLPLQPYVYLKAKMALKSGTAGCDGTFRMHESRNGWDRSFTGNVWSEGFRATDTVLGKDFLRWTRLDLTSLAYASTPPTFTVGDVIAKGPYLRFLIDSTRTTNFHSIMVEETLATDSSQPAEPAFTSRVGAVRITDGSMYFADFSMTPAFETGIQEMSGSIRGLSSEELTRGTIDLNGKVDRYAPVIISGQLNPLSEQAYTDILLRFENIELTTFSPYFTKFAGYRIDKGKLLLDLRYKLNKDELEGENKIVLDQLTLGEAVEGPDVTDLPVRLAIALLKDSKGVIDIDLPVSGNINDPEFSLAPIVWKAVLNLLVKAVTSPFKLLGALFGGSDDDLSYTTFAPGVDTLGSGQTQKIGSLATSLNERPELVLDVRGLASDSLDRPALKEAALQKRLGIRSSRSFTGEELKRLSAMYQETFNSRMIDLVPESDSTGNDLSAAERESRASLTAYARLLDRVQVGEEELRSLARNRAAHIKDLLVQQGNVAPQRVFLLDVDVHATPTEGEIRLPLALDAR